MSALGQSSRSSTIGSPLHIGTVTQITPTVMVSMGGGTVTAKLVDQTVNAVPGCVAVVAPVGGTWLVLATVGAPPLTEPPPDPDDPPPPVVTWGPNLLVNPGMETVLAQPWKNPNPFPSGWSDLFISDVRVASDGTHLRTGTTTAMFKWTTGDSGVASLWQTIPVDPSTTYKFTGWVVRDAASAAFDARMLVSFGNATIRSRPTNSTLTATLTAGTTYAQLVTELTSPADATEATIVFAATLPTLNAAVWFDDAEVRRRN